MKEHTQIQELLGVYAVNAVNDGERSLVEQHLSTCQQCQAEVDEHIDTAAMLGTQTSARAVPSFDQLRDHLDVAITPISAPKKQFSQPLMAIAAAALLLVGIAIGTQVDGEDSNSNLTVAQAAIDKPGARVTTLSSAEGQVLGTVVVLPGGEGYLLNDKLPELGPDKTYQLWAVVNGEAISAAVMGSGLGEEAFTMDGPVTAFAVTAEVAGGVTASVQQPVASGPLSA